MNKMKTIKFVPKKTLTDQPIEIKKTDEKIILSSKPHYGPTSKLILNKEFDVDENFWFALGLFTGEKTRDKRRVAVTNSNPFILKAVINMFEKIGITRDHWKGVVSSNSYYIKNPDEFKTKSLKYWSNQLKIPENKILVTTYYRKPKRVRNTIPFGTMQLRIENVILVAMIDNIIASRISGEY